MSSGKGKSGQAGQQAQVPPGHAYPMQQTYPTQTGQYPQHAMPPPQYNYPAGPPPPYSAQPQQGYPQAYPQYPTTQYAQPPPVQPQTVVVPNAYDAGARFGAGSTANIPPPPPGVAPNAAQMAASQGQNVVIGRRKGDWLSGGSDGGYVWW